MDKRFNMEFTSAPTIFPTTDICRILNINVPIKGDTYVGCYFTLTQASELEAISALDLDERQNDSPTIGELLAFFREAGIERLRFIGYVIFPPRSDVRVSIKGFECCPVNESQKKLLRQKFRKADEFECRTGYCRAWWD